MNHLTRTVAAFAIAALPAVALAQTPRTGAAAQPNPAAEHLTAARAALNKVLNAPAPSGDAFKKLSDIKTHYLALEKAASTASPEWNTHYKEIDRLVTELLGAPSGEPGAVGTSGRAGAPASKGLDPAVTANLQDFRTHLTGFSTAMSGGVAASSPAAAPPAPAAPSATAPAVPAAPAPAAPATPPAAPAAAPASPPPATPATPPAPSPAEPSAPAAASAQVPAPAPGGPGGDIASIAAQVDQVMLLVDSALASNGQQIDRATLEQIKAQLEQIKQRVKKP
jgi:hypothetical protein